MAMGINLPRVVKDKHRYTGKLRSGGLGSLMENSQKLGSLGSNLLRDLNKEAELLITSE